MDYAVENLLQRRNTRKSESRPRTGWPEPGGFLPREALAILKGVAKEGVAAMEAVEVSPPYDISDITALVAVRALVDVLATMVKYDRIGGKLV